MIPKPAHNLQRGVIHLIIPVVIILIVLLGLVFLALQKGKVSQSPLNNYKQSSQKEKGNELWTEGGVAVAGAYADADVVDLGNGKFRMYYSAEPETQGFQGQVYSAVTSDGKNWSKEEGTRITSAIFPSVIKLPDGRFRMYFQDRPNIKSAISTDGLTWEREQGVRIDTTNTAGLALTGVLSPTVIKTGVEYLMVYAGAINEPYGKEKVPNKETHPLLWATSKDGLTFEPKGIAVDSRNETFKGWMDGPELVAWDDGTIRLYFFGYFGFYQSIFENGIFSEPEFVFYGPNFDDKLFPSDPPGDPTLAKIGNNWYLFYGYHKKGIYYATLDK